jgi:hypothetical protein
MPIRTTEHTDPHWRGRLCPSLKIQKQGALGITRPSHRVHPCPISSLCLCAFVVLEIPKNHHQDTKAQRSKTPIPHSPCPPFWLLCGLPPPPRASRYHPRVRRQQLSHEKELGHGGTRTKKVNPAGAFRRRYFSLRSAPPPSGVPYAKNSDSFP